MLSERRLEVERNSVGDFRIATCRASQTIFPFDQDVTHNYNPTIDPFCLVRPRARGQGRANAVGKVGLGDDADCAVWPDASF